LLASRVDSVREARQRVREMLAAHTDEETLGLAELVVSELVTNSLRHGPGGPITLRLTADGFGGIRGEVEDQGDGVVALREEGVRPQAGGLGLLLVDRLTTDWGVYPDSTHVWFRFAA
jgi:anti-sigma regulatory factor (Ser/Thr protein kinase)